MSRTLPILMAALALLLAQPAAASASPPPRPSPAARPRTDPVKLHDCEQAWAAQRIKKGSHRAFIRACVRHG